MNAKVQSRRFGALLLTIYIINKTTSISTLLGTVAVYLFAYVSSFAHACMYALYLDFFRCLQLTIPSEVKTDFNYAEFCVKIMSVSNQRDPGWV